MSISEEQDLCLNTDELVDVQPTVLLSNPHDDGELRPVVVKAGGWSRDGDGHSHVVVTSPANGAPSSGNIHRTYKRARERGGTRRTVLS